MSPTRLPAGQRSGSHADSVWPYLEEARRLTATAAEPAPAKTPGDTPLPEASPSWVEKLFGYLRGDSEAS